MDKSFHKNLFNEVPETFTELLELMGSVYKFYGVKSFDQLEESVQRGLMCAIRAHCELTRHKTFEITPYLLCFKIPREIEVQI